MRSEMRRRLISGHVSEIQQPSRQVGNGSGQTGATHSKAASVLLELDQDRGRSGLQIFGLSNGMTVLHGLPEGIGDGGICFKSGTVEIGVQSNRNYQSDRSKTAEKICYLSIWVACVLPRISKVRLETPAIKPPSTGISTALMNLPASDASKLNIPM